MCFFLISAEVVLATIFVTWVLASFAWSAVEFLPTKQLNKFYGLILTVPFFFVPLIVISGAYGTMFHIARAHARRRRISSFKKVQFTTLLLQYITELPKIQKYVHSPTFLNGLVFLLTFTSIRSIEENRLK